MEEWKKCKLGDFFELHRGYDLTKSEIKEGPYPVVCSTSIMGYHNEYKVRAPGVVIGRSGTLGEVQFIDKDFWPHNTSLYVSDFKGNSPKFIKYFLQLFGTGNVGGGSAVPTLNRNHLQALAVKVPPLPTQQKIAAILSSLDDKIELNNKINTNLEQQAGALFKNWFVDFEPFGGKMPEGWKVGKLCDIADYSSEKIEINKLSPETYYSTENMLPSKGGIETATSLPSISHTTRCLPGETIISNIRPYFKKIFYCTEEVAGCSTDVLCFKPKNKDYSEYLYQVLYSDIFFDYMVLGSKGTKMPRGDKQQIMNYTITIPDELYLHKYKTFAKPILSQIDTNRKENKRLSEIRDTLLPKLMNGEIEVGI